MTEASLLSSLAREVQSVKSRLDEIGDNLELGRGRRKASATFVDILDFEPPAREVLTGVARLGRATASELESRLNMTGPELLELLEQLTSSGYLAENEVAGEKFYIVAVALRRPRAVAEGLWASLAGSVDAE